MDAGAFAKQAELQRYLKSHTSNRVAPFVADKRFAAMFKWFMDLEKTFALKLKLKLVGKNSGFSINSLPTLP